MFWAQGPRRRLPFRAARPPLPSPSAACRRWPPPFGKLVNEEVSEQPLYAKPSEDQRPRIVTQRLIDYATVLHLGTFALEQEEELASLPVATDQGTAPPAQSKAATPATTIVRPDIVTLIVSPQDPLAVNWAIKAGGGL